MIKKLLSALLVGGALASAALPAAAQVNLPVLAQLNLQNLNCMTEAASYAFVQRNPQLMPVATILARLGYQANQVRPPVLVCTIGPIQFYRLSIQVGNSVNFVVVNAMTGERQ